MMHLVDLEKVERSETGFSSYLTDLCDALELDHATYCAVNTVSNSIVGFTTYPEEWRTHYGAQGFQNTDPTLILPMRSIAPVDWSRLRDRDDFKKVFEHASEFHIAEQGLSIPIHGPYGEVGLISVARAAPEREWEMLRRKIIGDLQAAAVNLHDTVMQSDPMARALHRPTVSEREREVLQWTAAGKSQADIGAILAISSRTVEVHLRSARSKLAALSTAQAIGRAIATGLIEPR